MSILVLFMSTTEGEARPKMRRCAKLRRCAVVPPEGQTAEFLTLCGRLDGKLLGQDYKETDADGEAMEALCKPYGGGDSDYVTVFSDRVRALPAGAEVTRAVTVNYAF